jgi:hypothetical protein
VPWLPEAFTAPVQERLIEQRQLDSLTIVPFFDGLLTGDHDALVDSFAGEPDLYDPLRGHVHGAAALRAYADEMRDWVGRDRVQIEDVSRVIVGGHGFEEVMLRWDSPSGAKELPFAGVAEHPDGRTLTSIRLYYSCAPLTGSRQHRPALLPPDPALPLPDVVAELCDAVIAADAGRATAGFEADGYLSEPAGAGRTHRGTAALRSYFERLFTSRTDATMQPCAAVDDGRTCALEHVVGGTETGLAVLERGESGRLAAVRLYDDLERPG